MIRSNPSAPRESGFTLAETLVALFILSILSVAGGQMLLRATASGEQMREREAEVRELDVAQAFIRGDLEAAVIRGVEPAEGFDGAMTLVGGETNRTEGLLRLVRSGWVNPDGLTPRSTLQAIRYDLTDEGELVRTAWLRPDAARSTPTAERVLLKSVEAVELSFWAGDEMSTYWEGTPTPPNNVLPQLIEMRIVFEDGRVLTIASGVGAVS